MGRGPGPEGAYRLFADRLLVHMETWQREIVRITGRSTESIGQRLGEAVVEPAQALSEDRIELLRPSTVDVLVDLFTEHILVDLFANQRERPVARCAQPCPGLVAHQIMHDR